MSSLAHLPASGRTWKKISTSKDPPEIKSNVTQRASRRAVYFCSVAYLWTNTERERVVLFGQRLQMLTLRGLPRPKSVNSWPTWREQGMQKLEYVVLSLRIIQLELNDNQRVPRIRGWGCTAVVAPVNDSLLGWRELLMPF